MVFAGSWLPLNVFNIVADFDYGVVLALDRSGLIFAGLSVSRAAQNESYPP